MTTPTTHCFKIKKEWINQYKAQEASVKTTKPSPKLVAPTKKTKPTKRALGHWRRPKGTGTKKPKLSPQLQNRIALRNSCLQFHRACAISDIESFGSYVPDCFPEDPRCKRIVIATEPFLDYWLEKKCPYPV